MKAATRQIELVLPLIPDMEITAANAASDLGREIGMSENSIDEAAHAIVEACINAREHSCCADKRIYLRFVGDSSDEEKAKLEVWITDHGQGFDPDQVRERRVASEKPKKRGWGLQIMEAHMDEVRISSSAGGTTVYMVKYGERQSND